MGAASECTVATTHRSSDRSEIHGPPLDVLAARSDLHSSALEVTHGKLPYFGQVGTVPLPFGLLNFMQVSKRERKKGGNMLRHTGSMAR